MRYLIDTDWMVDVLRRVPGSHDRVRARRESGIGISVITLAELYVGPHKRERHRDQLEAISSYVSMFTELAVDSETAEVYGRIKAHLELSGEPIGDCDTLIAATALQHDLTLLTNNARHFDRVRGLRTESG